MAISIRFRPIAVLAVSLGGAFIYALWASRRFSGAGLTSQYFYVVPIVVPFIAFLLDRVTEIREAAPIGYLVDSLVVGMAMMRVVASLPFVSGHALFLAYAMIRPGSWITRITATVVMLQVIYLKFFVWNDSLTPLTGIALGSAAALIVRRLRSIREKSESTV